MSKDMVLITSHRPYRVNEQEEWPRPPTYVGGGLRMSRVDPPEGCNEQVSQMKEQ